MTRGRAEFVAVHDGDRLAEGGILIIGKTTPAGLGFAPPSGVRAEDETGRSESRAGRSDGVRGSYFQ